MSNEADRIRCLFNARYWPMADIRQRARHGDANVRFRPKADIRFMTNSTLGDERFDRLITLTTPKLTTLEADGWAIDDGELVHAESPDTFRIPPLSDRRSLEPGSIAKLLFYIRAPDGSGELVDHGERMWVQVKELRDDWYLGALDNDPYCTDSIQAGLLLWFQPRHVIDIYRG